MIKLVPRSSRKASSKATLSELVDYISDAKHPYHLGKTILPAKNYNCPISSGDGSGDSFVSEVLRLDEAYRNYRSGRVGKRSPRLLEEVIYSSPHGAHLTDLERASIEAMIIQQVGRSTACRAAWHLDMNTGRADFHVLLAAKNTDYPPRVTLWADFGGDGGRHIYAEFDKLDKEITTEINNNPLRKTKVKSADQVRRESAEKAIGKKDPLWKELADKYPASVNDENIRQAIEILGYKVTKCTRRSVSIQFSKEDTGPKGKPVKARRYNIQELVDAVIAEKELNLEKEQAKLQAAKNPVFLKPIPLLEVETPPLAKPPQQPKRHRYRPTKFGGLEDPDQP